VSGGAEVAASRTGVRTTMQTRRDAQVVRDVKSKHRAVCRADKG
jgi:hypothetical protein